VRQADSGGPVAVPLTGTAAPAMRPSRPTMTRACSGSGLVHLDRSPLLTRGPKGSVSGLIQERNMFRARYVSKRVTGSVPLEIPYEHSASR